VTPWHFAMLYGPWEVAKLLFHFLNARKELTMALDCQRRHFQPDAILILVRWYLAYALSYRDGQALAAERGLSVDHNTVHRWVVIMRLN